MTEQANAIGSRKPAKDEDLDFGGLAVGVFRGDTLPEGLEAAHPLPGNGLPANHDRVRLDPASCVVSVQRFQNARPQCRVARRVSFLAIAAGQSSYHGRPFLRIGMIAVAWRSIPLVHVNMHCRAVDGGVAAAGVTSAIRCHGADIFPFGDPVEQVRQHGAVTVAAGGELHRPNVRSGRVGANAVFAKQRETAIAASTETQHPDIMTSLAIAKKFAPGRTCSHTSRCSTTQNASTRTTACCRPPSHRLLGNRLPGNG